MSCSGCARRRAQLKRWLERIRSQHQGRQNYDAESEETAEKEDNSAEES